MDAPANLSPRGSSPTLDTDGAAAFPDRGILLDARAGERFRGEVEPLDPRAGHIPGAVNAPAATLFTPDGRLPDDDTVSAALGPAATGDRPVAVYCGSGVSAARDVLALAVLGVDAGLFPGSWSAWSNDPAAAGGHRSRPVHNLGTVLWTTSAGGQPTCCERLRGPGGPLGSPRDD